MNVIKLLQECFVSVLSFYVIFCYFQLFPFFYSIFIL